MCVCVCVCVNRYIHARTHTHTHTHIYIERETYANLLSWYISISTYSHYLIRLSGEAYTSEVPVSNKVNPAIRKPTWDFILNASSHKRGEGVLHLKSSDQQHGIGPRQQSLFKYIKPDNASRVNRNKHIRKERERERKRERESERESEWVRERSWLR